MTPTYTSAAGEVFLSTPSVWRATMTPTYTSATGSVFLSTPSVWRATY